MEKIKRFDILVFLEVQEINLRGNLRDNKCDEYLIFLWDLFQVSWKSSFPFLTL